MALVRLKMLFKALSQNNKKIFKVTNTVTVMVKVSDTFFDCFLILEKFSPVFLTFWIISQIQIQSLQLVYLYPEVLSRANEGLSQSLIQVAKILCYSPSLYGTKEVHTRKDLLFAFAIAYNVIIGLLTISIMISLLLKQKLPQLLKRSIQYLGFMHLNLILVPMLSILFFVAKNFQDPDLSPLSSASVLTISISYYKRIQFNNFFPKNFKF